MTSMTIEKENFTNEQQQQQHEEEKVSNWLLTIKTKLIRKDEEQKHLQAGKGGNTIKSIEYMIQDILFSLLNHPQHDNQFISSKEISSILYELLPLSIDILARIPIRLTPSPSKKSTWNVNIVSYWILIGHLLHISPSNNTTQLSTLLSHQFDLVVKYQQEYPLDVSKLKRGNVFLLTKSIFWICQVLGNNDGIMYSFTNVCNWKEMLLDVLRMYSKKHLLAADQQQLQPSKMELFSEDSTSAVIDYPSYDDTNETEQKQQDEDYGIIYYTARALSILLNHNSYEHAQFLSVYHVHDDCHEDEDDTSTILQQQPVRPTIEEIRNVIPIHDTLLHVGKGILLPIHQTANTAPSTSSNNLILTETTTTNIFNIGLGLCTTSPNLPILLYGPKSSGKSCLLSYLASKTNYEIVEFHFDAETDYKSLLGTYVPSSSQDKNDGMFTYKEGMLTQAVRNGNWVILEDIDKVASCKEILQHLSLFLDSRVLTLNSGEKVRAADSFRLFATCTSHEKESGIVIRNTYSKWNCISIQPLPTNELLEIIQQTFPTCRTFIMERIMETYNAILELQKTAARSSIQRNISVRDLMKVCNRIIQNQKHTMDSEYVTESQRMICLLEMYDVFLASSPSKNKQVLISILSTIWEVDMDLLYRYLYTRKPDYALMDVDDSNNENASIQTIGRVKFLLSNTNSTIPTTSIFAQTSYSLRYMEYISKCIQTKEPLLIVGETGVGKTFLVQLLSQQLQEDLIVLNLSLQTDSTDLLGGFRPTASNSSSLDYTIARLVEEFEHELFGKCFSLKENTDFITFVKSLQTKNLHRKLCTCFRKAANMGMNKMKEQQKQQPSDENDILERKWKEFVKKIHHLEISIQKQSQEQQGLQFDFMEGGLVEAITEGKWILLDEINLASSETLQRLTGLLNDGTSESSGLVLTERGDTNKLKRHENFRLLAAMNPATDTGKKELPVSIRSRFTELYVEELVDAKELEIVAGMYLQNVVKEEVWRENVVGLYLCCRKLAEDVLVDGSGNRPRYTLRTFTRALNAIKSLIVVQRFTPVRAIMEGFELAFEGPLDTLSRRELRNMFSKVSMFQKILKDNVDHPCRKPKGEDFVLIKPFWIKSGTSRDKVDWSEAENASSGRKKFVVTPTAKYHLRRLARILSTGSYPILLEGPTSSGKTTLVEYLAARLGYTCFRINNHEHTDVQEYTGCYTTDTKSGNLVFQEGVLVRALREGHWIILDELNLAPSEVLEALNRLLDDNRELYVAEMNEVVKPHENFRLFATQNPCGGVYGGRKPLSRAFRNRFVEVHVEDIPSEELMEILQEKCGTPPSHAKLLIRVMMALRTQRNKSEIFRGKDGFITLRDLLRWAERYRDCNTESTKKVLALEGYILLAERLRSEEEKLLVKQVIEKEMKVTIDYQDVYYGPNALGRRVLDESRIQQKDAKYDFGWKLESIGPTKSLMRLLFLVKKCMDQKEPVLLVGDTGIGKTTVVQLLSLFSRKQLYSISCHASTETSDILGGLRPVRGRNIVLLEMTKVMVDICQILIKSQWNVDFIPDFIMSWIQDSSTTTIMEFDVDTLSSTLPVNASTTISSFIKSLKGKLKSSCRGNKSPSQRLKKRPKLDASNTKEVVESIDNEQTKVINDENDCPSELNEYSSLLKSQIAKIEKLHQHYTSLFEWSDGPLVQAMHSGSYLLLDEISLAEDAVLERLNSVLEPGAKLLLAEKGKDVQVVGQDGFCIFATMNPGGDFGKRELSPALRSRFTEIWVPPVVEREDFDVILTQTFSSFRDKKKEDVMQIDGEDGLNNVDGYLGDVRIKMLDYVQWFNQTICNTNPTYNGFALSLRDVVTWAQFILQIIKQQSDTYWLSYVQGSAFMHLDGLGLGSGHVIMEEDMMEIKRRCSLFLLEQIPEEEREACKIGLLDDDVADGMEIVSTTSTFGIQPFVISTGPQHIPSTLNFDLTAPTTLKNLFRILRALQLPKKPILLEGSPGVGKSSLVSVLAEAAGYECVRINLSEQTDIGDLMGSDLPVLNDDGSTSFRWCDGVFLQALKEGSFVLLDELNLASQTVLEGLNSIFDHRAQIFIPELNQTFTCHPSFRVFATQNPLIQGGGRKGLPKSFLNRFTKVYVNPLTRIDVMSIVRNKFPSIPFSTLDLFVKFNWRLHDDIVVKRKYGQVGSPWEFNLRDVFRLCQLMLSMHQDISNNNDNSSIDCNPQVVVELVDTIYLQRFRMDDDRYNVATTFEEVFCYQVNTLTDPVFRITDTFVTFGNVTLKRYHEGGSSFLTTTTSSSFSGGLVDPTLLRSQLRPLQSIAHCINMNWPVLLVGTSSSGKSTLLQTISQCCGRFLEEIALSSSSDVSDLIGCFEQKEDDTSWFKSSKIKKFIHVLEKIFDSTCLVLHLEDVILSDLSKSYWNSIQQLKRLLLEELKVRPSLNQQYLVSQIKVFLDIVETTTKHNLNFRKNMNAIIVEARHLLSYMQVSNINASKNKPQSSINFHWVDGPLIRAMIEGHWFHLENVNLCASSVLDRINPLLENPENEFVLAECGGEKARVIVPHENFRIFLSMNPSVGDVSRAMRNRCLEICLISSSNTTSLSVSDDSTVLEHEQNTVRNRSDKSDRITPQRQTEFALSNPKFDYMELLYNVGLRSASVANSILHYHLLECSRSHAARMSSPPSARHLIQFGKSVVELMSRGWTGIGAIEQSYQIVYGLKMVERLSLPSVPHDSSCENALIERMGLKEKLIPYPIFAHVAHDARMAKFLSNWNSSTANVVEKQIPSELKYISEWTENPINQDLNQSLLSFIEISDAMPYLETLALQSFVRKTSIHDIELRCLYFHNSSSHSKLSKDVHFMLSMLAHAFSTWKITKTILKQFYDSKVILQTAGDDDGGIDQLSFQQLKHTIDQQLSGCNTPPFKDGPITVKELKIRTSFSHIIYVQRLSQLLLEQKNYHHLKTDALKDMTELSVIEVSCCLNMQRIDMSLVDCPITPIIYKVFEALDGFLSEWQIKASSFLTPSVIDSDVWYLLPRAIKSLFESRDRLWDFLNHTLYLSSSLSILSFDEAGFIVQWTWFVKALDSFFERTTFAGTKFCLQSSSHKINLHDLVQSIHNTLFQTDQLNLYSDVLWKKGGHPLVPSLACHWKGMLMIREILQSFSPITEELFGYISTSSGDNTVLTLDDLVDKRHSLLYTSGKLRFEVLAALCTAFSTITNETGKKISNDPNEEDNSSEDLNLSLLAHMFQKRINHDQAAFSERMEAATMDVAINTPENTFHLEELEKLRDIVKGKGAPQENNFIDTLLHKWAIVQLSQVAEIWCIREELELLGAVSDILSFQSVFHCVNLVPRIKNWIQVVLSQTIWSPYDVRSFQTLVWACESVSSFTEEEFRYLLKHILPLMIFTSSKHMWCNTINDLDCISNSLVTPSFFWKHESNFMNEEQSPSMQETSIDEEIHSNKVMTVHNSGPLRLTQCVKNSIIIRLTAPSFAKHRGNTFVTLENHSARVKQCQYLIKQLCSMGKTDQPTSNKLSNTEGSLIRWLFLDVLEAFKEEFSDSDVFDQIYAMTKGNSMSFDIDSQNLSNICQNPALKHHIPKLVIPILNLFQQMKNNDEDTCDELTALTWVHVGLLQLHLLLPSSPLDPAEKPLVKSSQLDHHILNLRTKLTLHDWESKLNFSFDVPNPTDAQDLRDDMNHAIEKRVKYKKKCVQRPENIPRFVDLYREMHSFAKTIGNIDKVLDLAKSVASDEETMMDSLPRSKELNWQTSACAFCTRIYSRFQNYEDVMVPFLNAIRVIQHGLRKLTGVQSNRELLSFQKLLEKAVNTFLHYPHGNFKDISWLLNETYIEKMNNALSSYSHKLKNDSKVNNNQPTRFDDSLAMQLATTAHLEMITRVQCNGGKVNTTCAKQVMKMLFHIMEKWKNSLADEENEESSKSTNSVMESEAETTEKYYRELFPDHSREFLDIINQVENKYENEDDFYEEEESDVKDPSSQEKKICLTEEQISFLCHIHKEVFAPHMKPVDDACRNRTSILGYAAIGYLGDAIQWLHCDQVPDEKTTGAILMGISSCLNASKGISLPSAYSNNPTVSIVDFHKDANPTAILKAAPILRHLLLRIAQLLKAFPGNSILIALGKVAEKTLQLDISSVSQGKVLTALQVILRKAQEWEQHASQRVSLGSALKNVSKVVATWRKEELASWSSLLDLREKHCTLVARKHWMRMFLLLNPNSSSNKVLPSLKELENKSNSLKSTRTSTEVWVWKGLDRILGKKNSMNINTYEGKLDQSILDVIQIMDKFLLSSGIGEFPERLQLVQAYANQLLRICEIEENNAETQRFILGRCLRSLYYYYNEYSQFISTYRINQREPIEKLLKNDVKIAKWDEQTYYSLQDSADRSHRKLMKYMKDYDELLAQQVFTVLEHNFVAGVRPVDNQSDSQPLDTIPSKNSIFPLLVTIKQEQPNAKKSVKTPLAEDHFQDQDKWNIIFDDSNSYNDSVIDKYISNMPRYYNKMRKVIESELTQKDSWAKLGTVEANDVCDTVFERIESLRKEKTTRPMKQRALIDLFKTLKDHGFSSSEWTVPSQVREMSHFLQLPILDVSKHNWLLGNMAALKSADQYFYRVSVEMNRLRSEVAMFGSQHITQREMHMMLGFSEHGLMTLFQQKCSLISVAENLTALQNLLNNFSSTAEVIPTRQSILLNRLKDFEIQLKSLLEVLSQLLLLMKKSILLVDDDNKKTNIRDLIVFVDASVSRLNADYNESAFICDEDQNAQFISCEKVSTITNVLITLDDVEQELHVYHKNLNGCLPREIFSSCLTEFKLARQAAQSFVHVPTIDECNSDGVDSSLIKKNYKLISSTVQKSLIAIQGLCPKDKTSDDDKEETADTEECIDSSTCLSDCHVKNVKEWVSLDIKNVNQDLQLLTSNLIQIFESRCEATEAMKICFIASQSACRLLNNVLDVCKSRILELICFYRNSAKLIYVLLRVFRVLVAKGFCADNMEDDDGKDGKAETFEDDVDGTGMGSGEGKKDVSDEIEDEEQLLGLKGEEEKEENKTKDDKLSEEEAEKGMEMETDFDGEMHDLPDKQELSDDDDEQKDGDEEEELDREMGDDDNPDEEVVDEKMWDDEEDEDMKDDGEEEKFEKDSSMQGKKLDDETRTKEDGEDGNDDKEKANDGHDEEDPKDNKEDQNNQKEEEEAGDLDDFINEDTEDKYEEKNAGVDVRNDEENMDEEQKQDEDKEDEMDLDDLNLEDQGSDDEDDKQSPEEGEEGESSDLENQNDEKDDSKLDGDPNEQEDIMPDDTLDPSANNTGEIEQPSNEEDAAEEEEPQNNAHIDDNQQDHHNDDDINGVSDPTSHDNITQNVDDTNEQKEEDNTNDQQANETEESKTQDMSQENNSGGQQTEDYGGSHGEPSQMGEGVEQREESTNEDNPQMKNNNNVPNPFQNPGDVTQFWNKKLDMMERGEDEMDTVEDDANLEETKDGNNIEEEKDDDGLYEFSTKKEESTSQVLGKTMEEEEENNMPMKEEKKEEEMNMKNDSENLETMEEEENDMDVGKNSQRNDPKNENKKRKESTMDAQDKPNSKSSSKDNLADDADSMDIDEDDENESVSSTDTNENDNENEMEEVGNQVITDLDQLQVQDTDDTNTTKNEIEETAYQLSEVSKEEDTLARAQWNEIQMETYSMSRRLCEKLRLVMEPLIATKLQGDYRTGKRINMKRVIGFIASGYRKDKIWLRRTKPAKRNYRILLAVDDSQSMQKENAGHMALAALATLANGMNQLEVGELSIASFGEEMRVIHPFSKPFTFESGVDCVRNFTFKQKRTRTALCVESAISVLKNSEDYSSSSSSLNLVFMISDGRIERDSRIKLRKLIREMTECNILLVLIIVQGDVNNKKKKDSSIVNMKEVSFENGKPKMKNFMDDYPFPYYLIIEDITSLPEVLGDALRQWFEILTQIHIQGTK